MSWAAVCKSSSHPAGQTTIPETDAIYVAALSFPAMRSLDAWLRLAKAFLGGRLASASVAGGTVVMTVKSQPFLRWEFVWAAVTHKLLFSQALARHARRGGTRCVTISSSTARLSLVVVSN